MAQLVNFVILFGALTFLLYRPLLGVLEKRRKKIAEALENAERISEELSRANAESARIVSEARERAALLAAEAAKQAESARIAAIEKTRAEVASVVASGRAQISAERDAMISEVRVAAAELVAAVAEKVVGEKLSQAKDRHLIEKALEEKA